MSVNKVAAESFWNLNLIVINCLNDNGDIYMKFRKSEQLANVSAVLIQFGERSERKLLKEML